VIHTQRIRGVSRNALYKSTFTYLLTYYRPIFPSPVSVVKYCSAFLPTKLLIIFREENYL